MWQPEGPTAPHWGIRFSLKGVIIAHVLLFGLAILWYYFNKPRQVLVSNISWKAAEKTCSVSFTLSNLAKRNLSGTLSVRAMALSGTSPSNIHQASPYLVGQKSFPFTLGESESQSMIKEITSFQNHGCDSGMVVAVVND